MSEIVPESPALLEETEEMPQAVEPAEGAHAADPIVDYGPHQELVKASYDKLIDTVSSYMDADEIDKVREAYEFANRVHKGQRRKSGEPYVSHPIEVACILGDIRMDVETITAALLHDTVEDTDVTLEELEERFGPEVSNLVDGVTKITRLQIGSLSEAQANTLRKMLVAMSKDVRVTVIKLADRLHNMRTLAALPEDRRIFKAKETMEIYAPLANRLGISSIKWELEDLSFYYLEPAKYHQVSKMVAETREVREDYLIESMNILQKELDKLGIRAKIEGRPKHFYSIYQKMSQKGKDFSEIYDLIALRVIVEDIKDCYSSLGIVHSLWHPMPGRFKDYIAMPKFNMYQSLHTTVIGPAGRPLEVQIRTKEMHRISEYGIAAHWRYKESGYGKKSKEEIYDQQLAWLRQMLDWQEDEQDAKTFMRELKTDLFETEVFVFTPKGEVKSLKAGSTPLDFAYAVHTQVGHTCVGAKVNGSIVPLEYVLHSGDRVEIMTQQNHIPSRDWLNIVKTSSARSKIRSYLSKISKEDDKLLGRDMLSKEVHKQGLGISSSRAIAALKRIAGKLTFNSIDDMFASIGSGKTSPKQVANLLVKELQIQIEGSEHSGPNKINEIAGIDLYPSLHHAKSTGKRANDNVGVSVKGVADVMVSLSHCCNPVPGDEIVGYVTRGRGVTVHRADCSNIKDLMEDPDRFIEVEWQTGSNASFQTEIFVHAVDSPNLLRNVVSRLSDLGTTILAVNSNSTKEGFCEMRFTVQTSGTKQLDLVLRELNGVDGVFETSRVTSSSKNKKKKKGKG